MGLRKTWFSELLDLGIVRRDVDLNTSHFTGKSVPRERESHLPKVMKRLELVRAETNPEPTD